MTSLWKNAMYILHKYGKPTVLYTFTADPLTPTFAEIQYVENLEQLMHDLPDLIPMEASDFVDPFKNYTAVSRGSIHNHIYLWKGSDCALTNWKEP